jgi:hypothetical protein
MPPSPFGSSQGSPRIGKARGPAERQSSLFGLALQHMAYLGPLRGPAGNPSRRNVRVRLERQLNDTQPMADDDCRSVLPDVAERAKEIIPVQHGSRIIERVMANRQIRVTHDENQIDPSSRLTINRIVF